MHYSYVCMAIAMIACVGCSDPKAANEKNFGNAIAEFLKHEGESDSYCAGFKEYPHTNELGLGNELVAVGLLKVVGKYQDIWSSSVHDLTEKGRKFFTPGKGFCYGQPKLHRIVNFSEPSSLGPYTMSEVIYEYRIENIPEWALEEAVRKGHARVREAVSSKKEPIREEDTLILTNNGWVHEKLFKK